VPGRLGEYRLFAQEFVRNFRTTGALLPSGPWLAAALTRYLKHPGQPRMILEVGPGTGAVTRHVVRSLQPGDTLHLVELNDAFVAGLRDRFAHHPHFQPAAPQTTIFHCAMEELPAGHSYDVIVSGLPLNNFSGELVERLLGQMLGLLRPGGTLSFFEYIAVRRAKSWISNRAERERLRHVGRVLHQTLCAGEIRRDWIWPNVPPAWVHHVRRPAQP